MSGSDWVFLDSLRVSFAGEAIVNGDRGYRYEVHATDDRASAGPVHLSLRIWSAGESFDAPAYLAFGKLSEGEIRVRRAASAPGGPSPP